MKNFDPKEYLRNGNKDIKKDWAYYILLSLDYNISPSRLIDKHDPELNDHEIVWDDDIGG